MSGRSTAAAARELEELAADPEPDLKPVDDPVEDTPATKVIQRVAVTVVHEYDGELRTDVVVLKPVAMVAAERHFKGSVPPVEGTLYAAHWLLNREQRGLDKLPPFGVWLDDHVEAVEEGVTDPLEAPPAAQ